jgi:hypothetical protein
VNPLLAILKDSEQDRFAKLQAITALGDLAMATGDTFATNYLAEVLKIIDSASKTSTNVVSVEEDEDFAGYLSSLRESLIECYTSLVHGVGKSKFREPLVQYAPNIFNFLNTILGKAFNPSKNTIKNVCGLIGDIAACIGPNIKDLLRSQFVEQVVITMQNDHDPDNREIAQWTI